MGIYGASLPTVSDGMSSLFAEEGVANNAISASKLDEFLVHLFMFGLAWHAIGTYWSAISAFLEPLHYLKASDNLIISNLMCYLYLQ